MSTRELPYPPHRSLVWSTILSHLAEPPAYHCVSNGHCTLIGNPKCQRGSYRTRSIAHWFRQPSSVTSPSRRLTNAWSTAIAHPLVTRSVNEGATVPAPSLISNRPSLRCYLTDVSGYHCMANGQCTLIGNPTCQRGSYRTRSIAHWFRQQSSVTSPSRRLTIAWPTATAHLLVTRSVNEGATVPAPSLISLVNDPQSLQCIRVLILVGAVYSSRVFKRTISNR